MKALFFNSRFPAARLATTLLILALGICGCSDRKEGSSADASGSASGQKTVVLKNGTTAPPLRVKLLADVSKETSLGDFAGKFVVVDFWATWCPGCVQEMPKVRETYERFSNDPRFALLGVSLDMGPTAPRQFVAANGMKWNQGFAGTESERSAILDQWGVEYIPAVFLIGPDGKIIAQDIHGDEIAAAVGKAMAH